MPSKLASKLIKLLDLPSRFYQTRGDLAFKAFIIVDEVLGPFIGPVIGPIVQWMDEWQQRRYERAYSRKLAKSIGYEDAPLVRQTRPTEIARPSSSRIEQRNSPLLRLPREIRDCIYEGILPIHRLLLIQLYRGRLRSYIVTEALLKPLEWTQEQVAVQSLMGPPGYLTLLLTCHIL